jgi:hypothetical protein
MVSFRRTNRGGSKRTARKTHRIRRRRRRTGGTRKRSGTRKRKRSGTRKRKRSGTRKRKRSGGDDEDPGVEMGNPHPSRSQQPSPHDVDQLRAEDDKLQAEHAKKRKAAAEAARDNDPAVRAMAPGRMGTRGL